MAEIGLLSGMKAMFDNKRISIEDEAYDWVQIKHRLGKWVSFLKKLKIKLEKISKNWSKTNLFGINSIKINS